MNKFKQYLESIQQERKNASDFMPKDKDLSTKDEKNKEYKGTVLYLHGFPDNPSQNITRQLENEGFKVINPKIMYGKSFKEDKKSLMDTLVGKARGADLIIGSSFGGYIGFLLTGITKTPCILINPAISIATIRKHSGPEHADPNLYFYDKKDEEEYDNNITKIDSHFVDNDTYEKIIKNYPSGNEIFFGTGDALLPPDKTKLALKRLGVLNKFDFFTIKNMGHGHIQYVRHDEPGLFKDHKPIDNEWGAFDFFPQILSKSNILKKLIK